jgi:hypothetical protein
LSYVIPASRRHASRTPAVLSFVRAGYPDARVLAGKRARVGQLQYNHLRAHARCRATLSFGTAWPWLLAQLDLAPGSGGALPDVLAACSAAGPGPDDRRRGDTQPPELSRVDKRMFKQ